MEKIENKRVVNITTTEDIDFFTIWLKLMSPFLDLSNTELKFLTALIRKRHKIKLETNSEELTNILLFTTNIRQELRLELGIKQTAFNNILAKLKDKKYISRDNVIVDSIIPKVDLSKGNYIFNFNIGLK